MCHNREFSSACFSQSGFSCVPIEGKLAEPPDDPLKDPPADPPDGREEPLELLGGDQTPVWLS
ncbi:hypothetical protein [Agathobaculum desmolans]|uniref:hypothetical protein n=1 Tax=Agathobaculum desmolans TaxID=39484 RepID=UPI001A9A63B3|nr:hypothetical protein [Agathobaculum desmolans]